MAASDRPIGGAPYPGYQPPYPWLPPPPAPPMSQEQAITFAVLNYTMLAVRDALLIRIYMADPSYLGPPAAILFPVAGFAGSVLAFLGVRYPILRRFGIAGAILALITNWWPPILPELIIAPVGIMFGVIGLAIVVQAPKVWRG